ncbi:MULTISPECIES: hypothetical protein [Citrobacter]|uniref:hypothetical protein n=1 Tax=Citrobacter TaxID=544 RepID=UPI00106F0B2E|nr:MULTISPECIES: hypothetical protein [Citrobacter]MDM3001281.1 hypothetical protein [Citrobacter sp. CK192]MDM3023170.1 hypothetical protein [Citrobacter sp. CK193]QYG85210.1 hypothetical protein NCK_13630 [Citrobacter koseri]VFS10333.1 Uncharacterised protein [Citrobacter koseri]
MSKSDHKDDPVRSAYRRLQLVTPQLFAQYLAEKGVSKGCLACGYDKLSTPETMSLDSSRNPFKDKKPSEFTEEESRQYVDAAAVHYVTPSLIDESKTPLVSNHQYRLVCQNCGFISYFRAANVVHWVEDRINEQGDQP